eukprot:gnl/Chilomastix_cuspidata/3812.p1 GENE.gnl/Chilomastix_cuspidata/3812~~gnl/Chilomastix_cuspidata/3812.p1  ORF type:complete len:259 (-),score=47.90 gnl/Chilomastix_cuspidata/3812:87-863(-)
MPDPAPAEHSEVVYPCVTSRVLRTLAAAHARVESAFITRLESRLPCLAGPLHAESKAALAATHARAAVFKAAVKSNTNMHEATRLFGVVPALPDCSGLLIDEDVTFVVELASASAMDVRGQAEEAQLALDAELTTWPPGVEHAGAACAARTSVHTHAHTLLAGIADIARTTAARKAIAITLCVPVVAEVAESAARTDAEVAHVAAMRAAADHVGELQTRADCLSAVAQLEAMPVDEYTRRLVCAVLDAPRSRMSGQSR